MKRSDYWRKYIDEFNETDEEQHINYIANADAADWLKEEIPHFECPDKDIEKAYYFRWWTYRKHIKRAGEKFAVSEFLLDVPWAGKYNIINAAAGHHLAEGRWLKNAEKYLAGYIDLLIDENSGVERHLYSSWLIYALEEYFDVAGYAGLTEELFGKILRYCAVWEETHMLPNGMFWSIDKCDAMEISISGINETRGIRPTLNSYMYADYSAIARMARKMGKYDIEKQFRGKAERLKKLINERLWKDGFYRAFHYNGDYTGAFLEKHIPMEELGYIPWMFNIPERGRENVFDYLTDSRIFDAPSGITTADMRDEMFMYEFDHECLWNGYVWPFATAQTLNAMINVINNYGGEKYADDFVYLLSKYAKSHYAVQSDGKKIMWIDEVLHPFRQEWTSVTYLREHNYPKPMGPKGRGRHYNHSAFCDLVISGLCGVHVRGGKIEVKPIIPQEWDYFKLENLTVNGKTYDIAYARENGVTVKEI